MNVIVMGSGRVGARVASILDQHGHRVCVVDTNPDSLRRLGERYKGDTLIGTGIDADVLRRAGIEDADVFIAVTNGDNRNIMAAQVARTVFDVKHVIVRIYDPVREDTYRRLGLRTICPTTTMSALIIDQINDILPRDEEI